MPLEESCAGMTIPDGFKGLRFPCECVSAGEVRYSDPWAEVTKNRLLPNGTKEQILNLLAVRPNTVSQIAQTLRLSAPSVHTHVIEMLRSELVRHAREFEKAHPAERYYEPNFPVIKEDEAAELCSLCDALAERVASIFKESQIELENAFKNTQLSNEGWSFSEVGQFVFARVQRGARERLEQDGTLAPRKTHQNGTAWLFWAEAPHANGEK